MTQEYVEESPMGEDASIPVATRCSAAILQKHGLMGRAFDVDNMPVFALTGSIEAKDEDNVYVMGTVKPVLKALGLPVYEVLHTAHGFFYLTDRAMAEAYLRSLRPPFTAYHTITVRGDGAGEWMTFPPFLEGAQRES